MEISGTASVGATTPVKDTAVVYVADRSGSMILTAGVDCTGDTNDNNRLVCMQEAIKTANNAAAEPFSAVGETGLVSFATDSTVHDVNAGQIIVAPPGNLNAVVDSLIADGLTCYSCGLDGANDVLAQATSATSIVIFISDGINNNGDHVNTKSLPPGTIVKAFAIGDPSEVTCSDDSFGLGSMDDVAALGAAGSSCEEVTDFSAIANAIQQAIGSTLDSIEVTVDGNPIAIATSEPLPKNGTFDPKSVDYSGTAMSLGPGTYEICATATGTDAGGEGSVMECVQKIVRQLVAVDIKPGSDPNSINTNSRGNIPVAILGSETFDVSEIDASTLKFGPDGASPVHVAIEDVNGDGFDDLVAHFRTQETGISPGDTEACVEGELTGGTTFKGCDSVRTVPPS